MHLNCKRQGSTRLLGPSPTAGTRTMTLPPDSVPPLAVLCHPTQKAPSAPLHFHFALVYSFLSVPRRPSRGQGHACLDPVVAKSPSEVHLASPTQVEIWHRAARRRLKQQSWGKPRRSWLQSPVSPRSPAHLQSGRPVRPSERRGAERASSAVALRPRTV